MPKVFLSSTFYDMKEYRTAAFEAIEQFGHQCLRMETFPAANREIPEFVREKIAECDVFLLLLGRLYGTLIPGRNVSYTEDELDRACFMNKSRLVFTPTRETRFSAQVDDLIDRNIDIKEQKERQELFFRKAVRNIEPRPFKDAPDLKFQVGHSLSQFFYDQNAVGGTATRYSGEILPFLSDRTQQLSAFSDSFEVGSPGQPEIYVLYGHEEEQHQSCIRRLICRKIVYPARNSGGGMLGPRENGAVINWPDPSEIPDVAFRFLRRQLCEALDPKIPGGISTEAFCKLASQGPASHLVFRHPLVTEEWTSSARSLIASYYANFWREVGKSFSENPTTSRRPRIVIFFEFKHRFTDAASSRSFEQELRRFFETNQIDGVRTIFLPPLPQVRFADLNRWYETYKASLCNPYRTWPASKLFPGQSWPMIEVERLLHRYLGMETYAT